jgi:hypothetical protein
VNGHGAKFLTYINHDSVGFAIIVYVDVAGLFNPVAGGGG